MASRVYKKGDDYPPFNEEGHVRLYMMRTCPYAQRARIILEAKQIPYELIYICLRKQLPDWFRKVNPNGQVPALEFSDGRSLYESAVVCNYIDQALPGKKFTPDDPFIKAKHEILLSEYTKITANYYKLFSQYDHEKGCLKDGNTEDIWNNLKKGVQVYENLLQDKYFGGNEPALIDFMMWPHIERFPALKSLYDLELDPAEFPRFTSWIATMKTHPAVKSTMLPDDLHLQFIQTVLTGNSNYAIGLEQSKSK